MMENETKKEEAGAREGSSVLLLQRELKFYTRLT